MSASILYTVFGRKEDRYQAITSQDWKTIVLNGMHLRNLLLEELFSEETPLFISQHGAVLHILPM